MRKFPFVKQSEDNNCGPTCLLMIINYYKGSVEIGELSNLTNNNQNGTTAYDLVLAANKLGFDSKAYKGDIKNLKELLLPCIAHVIINDSFHHYVVIYKINYKKEVLTIADPAIGIKKISFDDFLKIWSGVVITLEPSPNIELPKKKNKLFNLFIYIFLNYKYNLINIIFMSVLITILSIIISYYFQISIITLNKTNSIDNLLLVFISFIIIYILKSITELFRNKLFYWLDRKIDYLFTKKVFSKIISLPYKHYRNHTTGNIISRINDLTIIKNLFSKIFMTVFVDFSLSLFSSFFLYSINPKLFFISLLMFILFVIIFSIFKPILKDKIIKIQEYRSLYLSYLVEAINSFETIKGINVESKIIEKLDNKYMVLLKNNYKFNNLYVYENFIKELINNLGFCIIVFFGCLLVIKGELELSKLITFNSLLFYFLDPIKNIINLTSNINEANNSLNRISELFIKYKDDGFISRNIIGNINYKNLSYSYNNKTDIIKNVNLNIKAGSKVMILGKSGSGKSTLFKLLMKYYKADRGTVFIDDIDINDYNENSIKDNICYVSQNEILYTDTIYNNIVLDREIGINDFLDVQKCCYIEDILINNNLGFNMVLAENGSNISGGEKQRIVMARSLLKNFNILIIDEALNQLDIDLERKILNNIFNKFNDKTIVFISHRIDNKDLFDDVININLGEVIYA